jgi:sugar phosphate isomerase/epimerase
MGELELVDLYWTSAGPVEVHYGREWSLFDWRDRCAQAARVGFRGLGLWHADTRHQLQTRTLAEMKQIFDELRRLLFDVAATFGAHHIKVGNIPGRPCELGRLTEAFAALCDEAADHTDAAVIYEFMPPDVNVHDLPTALALVREAGRSNGKLGFDTWHLSKLSIPPADVAAIPAEHIGWVELSDGQFEDMEDPIDEVTNHRCLPGEGEFDIPGYVRALQHAGYPGPWGVEVLSQDLRALPMEEQFERAYETTVAQFEPAAA